MYRFNRCLSSVAIALAATAAYGQSAKPATHYWMSVETRSMTMPGMSAEDMAMMAGMGREMPGAAPQRALTLQLSAPGQQPNPDATHDIPPGQNMGRTLPLKTPAGTAPVGASPEPYEKPRGRMLLYWGCGEAVRAGQPLVIDFANMDPANVKVPPGHVGSIARPPAPARDRVYGTWPYERNTIPVPRDSSLVGDHYVHGNYPPEIRFSIGAAHDFMAPVAFSNVTGGIADAIGFQWNSVPTATGYFAMAVGGVEKGAEVIMWTSSEVAEMGAGLSDYLPPATVQRLIQEKVVMSPQTSRCTVPEGIFKSAQGASLTLHAYGGELNQVYPPKPADPKAPWDPLWYVKVRVKSTGMTMLGVDDGGARRSRPARPQAPGASRQAPEPQSPPSEPAPEKAPGPLDSVNKLKGLFGF